ncbi:hypothetical protein [Myxococcus sp. CA040A]|uniref:hypothetical protein n=1 Tax=Myxococcus sp. CA040A TaxID=2741738 RepID=UPI00157A922C|nr:hypothetical protein [Myxococcus sp. CA040A]NTX07355.1 hypothetical protein [Myxococcus sp. CA040A]
MIQGLTPTAYRGHPGAPNSFIFKQQPQEFTTVGARYLTFITLSNDPRIPRPDYVFKRLLVTNI